MFSESLPTNCFESLRGWSMCLESLRSKCFSHSGAGVGVSTHAGASVWRHSGASVWSHSGVGVWSHSSVGVWGHSGAGVGVWKSLRSKCLESLQSWSRCLESLRGASDWSYAPELD